MATDFKNMEHITKLTLPGYDGQETFHAWIEDGKKNSLAVFNKDHLVRKDRLTAYLCSNKDQKFRVCVKVDETERAMCCDLTIDGQCVSSYFMGKWNSHRSDKGITFEDIDGGPGQIIPLRFGQTDVSVNGTEDEDKLEELGSIKVEIFPIRIKEARAHYRHRIEEQTVYHMGKVHPLKAHSAKYVKQSHTGRERVYYKTERINPRQPMATFIFKYRCEMALELMGILPRRSPINFDVERTYFNEYINAQAQDLKWIRDRCHYQGAAIKWLPDPDCRPHKYTHFPQLRDGGGYLRE